MLSFLQKSPAKSVEVAKEFDETLDWKLQIFDIIKDIRDPEKPETLEELLVVQEDLVDVCESIEKPGSFTTHIQFVPTVPHCSLATLIGLCIRTKLDQELPKGLFKIDLTIKEGTHSTAQEITKQINDKERVAAALENPNLRQTVDECINHESR